MARMINKTLKENGGTALGIENGSVRLSAKNIVLSLFPQGKMKGEKYPKISTRIGKEGYLITMDDSSINIRANTLRGLFYGTITLTRFLIGSSGSAVRVDKCRIIDYPDVRIRGAHLLGFDEKHIYDELLWLAENKINTVVIESWDYFHLDDFNKREQIKKVFAYARSLYIDPIPQVEAFSHVGALLNLDPDCAEGSFVKDQPYVFRDGIARSLNDNPYEKNLILTPSSPLVMTSLDKKTAYKMGEDFTVDRDTHYPYPQEGRPFRIKLTIGGSLHNGDKVLISYNCVKKENDIIPYCPSEPQTYAIMFRTLKQVISILRPKFIHLGHDEIIGMNKDSRCQKRHLSNAQILADEVRRLYDFVKKQDPRVRLMLWDDMFDPWHNGGNKDYQGQAGGPPGKTWPAAEMIPKDIIMLIWWYEDIDRFGKIKNAPGFFAKQGFDYLVSPWNEYRDIDELTKIAAEKKKCLGALIANWKGLAANEAQVRMFSRRCWNWNRAE